jgi:hypothetical protein
VGAVGTVRDKTVDPSLGMDEALEEDSDAVATVPETNAVVGMAMCFVG